MTQYSLTATGTLSTIAKRHCIMSVLSIRCKITKFDPYAFETQLNLYVTSTTCTATYFIILGYSFIGIVKHEESLLNSTFTALLKLIQYFVENGSLQRFRYRSVDCERNGYTGYLARFLSFCQFSFVYSPLHRRVVDKIT